METKGNILMQKYEVGRLLGQGNFAKVYYGKNLKTGDSVAIKVINKEKVYKAGLINQTKREISVMRMVKHPNAVQLYEVMATKTKIYFIMEYAKGGELFHKVAKGRLQEDIARKYFQQLINAVGFCHSRGVYHRDLKPENLLLDENGILKVSDFGLSALAESKQQDGLLHTTCGTPAYVAPEVINRRGYDGGKADIWSCGVILFVLLAGYLPFRDSNIVQMYKKIIKAEYRFPNWFPPNVRRLLSRILDPNPSTRISVAKIMETSWFRKSLDLRPVFTEVGDKGMSPVNTNVVSGPYESNNPTGTNLELKKPNNLNAFDIISLSTGFDLSGFFVTNDQKEEVQFTSNHTSSAIISKFADIAMDLKFKVKENLGFMRLEGCNEVRSGTLSVDVEIFEISPTFHLVEVKKSGGDAIEYQKILKGDIRPALKEIVWAWQGEQQNH